MARPVLRALYLARRPLVRAGHTGELSEAALGFGSAACGAVAWRAFEERERLRLPVAAAALVVFGGLWGAVYVLEPTLVGTVLGSALAVGGGVAVPGLVARRTARRNAATGGR